MFQADPMEKSAPRISTFACSNFQLASDVILLDDFEQLLERSILLAHEPDACSRCKWEVALSSLCFFGGLGLAGQLVVGVVTVPFIAHLKCMD